MPKTRVQHVLDWLIAHPGRHTPAEVARGIAVPTTLAARTLLYLAESGQVQRTRGTVPNGPGSSYYSALPDLEGAPHHVQHSHSPVGGSL